MPFGAAFDDVYEHFLNSTLEQVGFSVVRADDITNQRGIMGDIISNLEQCCIVVADLTDSNANVYYELGLAHALHKPVILLSQDVEELPFDIRTERVIQYETSSFGSIDKARQDLRKVAAGALTRDTIFSNPYSDYTRTDVVPLCADDTRDSNGPVTSPDAEFGDAPKEILEHQQDMEEGLEQLVEVTSSIGSRSAEVTENMNQIGDELDKLNSAPPERGQIRKKRALILVLAQEMNGYAKFLGVENDNYSSVIEKTRVSIEETLRGARTESEAERDSIEDLIAVISEVEESTQGFRQSTDNAADAVSAMPPVDRALSRARDSVAEQLRRLLGNIDQILSMLARAKEIAQERLDGLTAIQASP